jgi:glucosylceramidase
VPTKFDSNWSGAVAQPKPYRPERAIALVLALVLLMMSTPKADEIDYHLDRSARVLSTSAAGDRLADKDNVTFTAGSARQQNRIQVYPDRPRQRLLGIGSSFTESSAFVLAHLEPAQRAQVMKAIFGEQGANFALARTPIGSTDFSVEGRYSYAPVSGDSDLEHFDIGVDRDGFLSADYPGVRDESFDLLPMIRQALEIKNGQQDPTLRIMASAWTAPPWMKDIDDWYQQGSGGSLKSEYLATYADYLVKYLDAYAAAGVYIWALTPVNEPLGNNGQWESMHFSAESQRDFIKHHLGPKLRRGNHDNVELFMLDHSRDHLETWAEVMYSDSETAQYLSGAAVHWYESTFKVYEDVFERVNERYPGFSIIHSEGCIDDLGKDAPGGVLDPVGFKESGWFDNDDFWWNDNASDWAYSVTWEGVNADDHPMYTPAHRYARNIIVSLNHWMTGWIDWNIVLDARGGPNHVGNYCGAPIMVDTVSGYVYYTPIYYLLSQFSRSIRPGDVALQTETMVAGANPDALHASASVNDGGLLSVQVLNTTQTPVEYDLRIGRQHAAVTIDANALQTLQIQLPPG